jgi:hypothetical protein
MLDDEEYGDLQVFKAVNGISSDSEALALAFRRFSRGAIGSMPDLSRLCCPSPSINVPLKGSLRGAGA